MLIKTIALVYAICLVLQTIARWKQARQLRSIQLHLKDITILLQRGPGR